MSLGSFLRPTDLETAPVPEPGTAAPKIPGDKLHATRPRLVLFLRHVGCPFAEASLRALDDIAEEHPWLECVAVSHGSGTANAAYWHKLKIEHVRAVNDPEREIYARYGLGVTPLKHFVCWDSVSGAMELLRRGIRNRRASGSRWQSAGAFAVDATGVVRWCHVPDHAADLPPLDALGETLRPLLVPPS